MHLTLLLHPQATGVSLHKGRHRSLGLTPGLGMETQNSKVVTMLGNAGREGALLQGRSSVLGSREQRAPENAGTSQCSVLQLRARNGCEDFQHVHLWVVQQEILSY